ncbi:PQQ-binding-like beta-propeller repeat protein [Halarchaeum sp. P4]|uniref:PQQ-binding-like beta-propeller repeat protein n=1 Tax=Halarchaeum sp. P4 TaxID=3421639 RepID=UPI003EB74C81
MPSSTQTRRGVLAAAGATGVAALTGCLGRVVAGDDRVYHRDAPVGDVRGSWPTYQHDFANTGTTDDSGPSVDATVEGVASGTAAIATSVVLADGRGVVGYSDGNAEDGAYRGFELGESDASWTVTYPLGKSTPTVAGDAMFVSTAEFLAAYDARRGELCWRLNTGGLGAVSNAPVLAADTLLSDGGETVYGRDPETGKTRWQYESGQSGPALVARDGVAYTTVGADGTSTGVAAVDPATGEERWRREGLPQSVAPLVAGDTHLYYAAHRGDVYALSLADGTTQWTATLPLPEDGSAYLAVADGRLHAQSPDTTLAALDTETGGDLWRRTLGGEPHGLGPRPPAIAGDTRFALDDDAVYALDAETGETRWSLALDVEPGLMSAPSVRDDALYYAGVGREHSVFRVAD